MLENGDMNSQNFCMHRIDLLDVEHFFSDFEYIKPFKIYLAIPITTILLKPFHLWKKNNEKQRFYSYNSV